MNEALLELKSKIASFKVNLLISDIEIDRMRQKTTIVFMAGGLSSRFSEVSRVQKSSFELPNGDTMIEMALRLYLKMGFKKFAILVSYQADEIVNRLGDGSKYGVTIKYSSDPKGSPIGKGGALRNALENNTIDTSDFSIIHNPDDVILDLPNFPNLVLSNFNSALKENFEAMVVVVSQTPYDFSGMKINNGEVTEIEMYPQVPIPAHVGVTILSPNVYKYFKELFDYNQKTDFEKVLFPILTREKKLFAMEIPENCWIAVNNLKSYNNLIKRIS